MSHVVLGTHPSTSVVCKRWGRADGIGFLLPPLLAERGGLVGLMANLAERDHTACVPSRFARRTLRVLIPPLRWCVNDGEERTELVFFLPLCWRREGDWLA